MTSEGVREGRCPQRVARKCSQQAVADVRLGRLKSVFYECLQDTESFLALELLLGFHPCARSVPDSTACTTQLHKEVGSSVSRKVDLFAISNPKEVVPLFGG